MPRPQIQPNDPDLFNRLVRNVTSFTENGLPFAIDAAKYDYPHKPDNIRQMGENLIVSDSQRVNNSEVPVAGKVMAGDSLRPDGIERSIFAYIFNKTHRVRYSRIGELVICGEAMGGALPLDLYWLETDGTVWTKPAVRYVPYRRQLIDHEVEFLEAVTRSIISGW